MKVFVILFFAGSAFCQTVLQQPEYRRIFANHLFCNGEYLRAVEEYRILLDETYNDTSEFKLFLSLSGLARYDEALTILNKADHKSSYSRYFLSERLKILLSRNEFDTLRETYLAEISDHSDSTAWKLKNISYLYSGIDSLPSPPYFLMPFTEQEKKDVSEFYEMKNNLPQKSPGMAGFLSAIIPGAGKIYTEEYGDAVFAALTSGIFGYLAYANFNADHQFRGYLFSGIALWFYGGNIYGSAASATLYNAKINFSFTSLVDNYLKLKNFFIPDYGFCE